MANKKNKVNEYLLRFLPTLLVLLTIVNGLVIFLFEKDRKPKVVFMVRPQQDANSVNTNTVINIVSNMLDSSNAVVTNTIDRALDYNKLPVIATLSFDYYVFCGEQYVRMFENIDYSCGSMTSYGRITAIFPDRILIDDCCWIANNKSFSMVRKEPIKSVTPSPSSTSTNKSVRSIL